MSEPAAPDSAGASAEDLHESERLRSAVKTKHDTKKKRLRKRLQETLPATEGDADMQAAQARVSQRLRLSQTDVRDDGGDGAGAGANADGETVADSATAPPTEADSKSTKPPKQKSKMTAKAMRRQKLEEEQRQAEERRRLEAEEAAVSAAATVGGGGLSREDRLTRFDTATVQELRQSKADRTVKLAKLSWDALREKKELTEEEQVGFFANAVWEEDEDSAAAAAAADSGGTDRVDGDTGAAEDGDILVFETEKVYLHRAIVQEEADESQLYFYPSTDAQPPVTLDSPCDPAAEGLYVGRRPRVGEGNILRLQNILTIKADLYEEKKDWIGEDGQLRILPDPLRDVPMRPLIFEEELEDPTQQPPELQREYRSARRWDSPFANLERETPWQLEVDIGSVQFLAHPLFTLEHSAVSRLRQLYAVYAKFEKLNFPAYFRDRVAAIRRELGKLDQEVARQERSQQRNQRVLADCRARIDVFRSELETTRQSRLRAEAEHYSRLIELIEAWREVRTIRQEAGFSVTDIRCDIEETVQSKSQDEQDRRAEVAEWLEERRAAAQTRYERQMEAYAVERRDFETRREEYERVRLRMEQSGLETADFEEQPPVEPQMESLEEFGQQLDRLVRLGEDEHGQVTCLRRQPGEPLVRFRLLENSNVPTPLDQIPAPHRQAEELRRNKMESLFTYCLRIYADDKLVGPTDFVTLSSNFMLHFNRVSLVEVVQPPTKIRLDLVQCQRGRISTQTKVIGHVTLPKPDSQTTRVQVNMSELRFTYKSDDRATAAGDANPAEAAAVFEGVVRARCGWRCDSDGNILAPALKVYDPQLEMYIENPDASRDKPVRLTELKDPNDPWYVRLNYHGYLGEDADAAAKVDLAGYCRFNFFEEEFDFCGREDLEADSRFKAIVMRDRAQLTTEVTKGAPMPPYASMINRKWVEDPKREPDSVVKARVSKLEKMRLNYERKMAHVREQVLDAFNLAKNYRSYDEVIKEASAVFVNIFTLIRSLFSRKRPLKPIREVSSSPTPFTPVTQLNLSINIQNGADFPQPNDKSVLKPFVEATFQGNSLRTATARGTNPDWSASIELPFRPTSAGQKPETISDELVLTVFNDMSYTQTAEGGQQDLSSVIVREKHFLASIAIPFSAIYINEKVKGRLQLRMPEFLMGYGASASEAASADGQQSKKRRHSPALKVFISLQPHLARPTLLQQTFDTAHDSARQWVHNTKQSIAILNEQVKKTRLELQSDPNKAADEFLYNPRAFVVSMEVKEVFVSCYMVKGGMPPPPELFQRGSQGEVTDLELKKAIVARYVSLVPFVSDASAFPGLVDIWNTCEEFLDYQAGDEEEHAVLLANYLTHLTSGGADTQIYLALGNAVPEGATAYVIEMTGNEKFVWNASTGFRYKAQSDRSTLVSIDCLINSDGVYINRKPYEEARALNNPLDGKTHWLHIPKPESATFDCIQQPIDYGTDAVLASEIGNIEYDIELAVRKEIESLRARVPTLWYNGGAKDVRELLKALETYHYDPNNQAIATAKEAHNRMFGSKVIVGYPLQMSYKSTKEILNDVRNTKLHEIGMYVDSKNTVPKVQFSCVVYVHQYPKNVLSIWINLMALKK
ncbi:hypothetical protein BOX15_Mlig020190g1 [Macrostomum lignano]|uniref:C2 domain-containing protein n=1 Tax=Macrostomum lignano TaxID=282301 RepID=A0A267EJ22_9PLAT|nr:hypothetical protein BOX15_Mlig020190g1 [Macrostomum lignano]